jgi:glyoxylase-like metal-dependent hydrolase (beta-lactamase superfamily II)
MKLTDNCYAVLGLGYSPPWAVNSGFVIGSKKTLIIDSGPMYLAAQTIYGYAKNIKPENELIVVNTEKHFDHIGGNSFFKEMGIKIYAHEKNIRTAGEFDEEKDYFNKIIDNTKRREAHEEKIFFQNTSTVKPAYPLKDKEIFLLGNNVEAKIIFTPGHTLTNISVFIPKDKVLYCGDCIINEYLPNLEAGTKEDWTIWLKSLIVISSMDIDYIVPGHGNVIIRSDINRKISVIRKTIEEAILKGKSPTSE